MPVSKRLISDVLGNSPDMHCGAQLGFYPRTFKEDTIAEITGISASKSGAHGA